MSERRGEKLQVDPSETIRLRSVVHGHVEPLQPIREQDTLYYLVMRYTCCIWTSDKQSQRPDVNINTVTHANISVNVSFKPFKHRGRNVSDALSAQLFRFWDHFRPCCVHVTSAG